MKKALPPLLFFITIALMLAALGYRYYTDNYGPNVIRNGKITIQITEGAKSQLSAGVPITLRMHPFDTQASPQQPGEPPSIPVRPNDEAARLETFMPMVITAFLGLVAVGLLIWRKNDADAQKWVYITFGAILGYWLKGGA
jgi:hypothetical protein